MQTAGGAMFRLVCPNESYNLKIPPIGFLGNGTLTGIVEFTKSLDSAQLYYFPKVLLQLMLLKL